MYNLNKNNIINFDKIIIEKYNKLNLDEVDTIILIRLNDLLNRGQKYISEVEIAQSMKINEKELANRIVELVNRGFISLEISLTDSKEVFTLDETYKRLGYLLEAEKEMNNDEFIHNKIKTTVSLLEKELKKMLSPIELEMVSKWYLEYQYSDEQIDEAILKALKYKNRGVNFINRSLAQAIKPVEDVKKVANGENIQDLFKKIYVNSK
jgi:DNA replication protein DnaD